VFFPIYIADHPRLVRPIQEGARWLPCGTVMIVHLPAISGHKISDRVGRAG